MGFRIAIVGIAMFLAGVCLSHSETYPHTNFYRDDIRFLFDYESETYYVLIDRSEGGDVGSFNYIFSGDFDLSFWLGENSP